MHRHADTDKMVKPFFKRINFFSDPRRYFIAFGTAITVVSLIKLFSYSVSDESADSYYEDYFNSSQSVHIPKNLNFAGEKTPISDFSVREAIERELILNTYWQSQSLLLHKRASRWFPVIEPILEKNGIPSDFKYIALIESQLTNVVSPKGATGFWQIVEPTARGYGLEISDEVDERYHIAKSTEAACKYFREAHKIFDDWTLVAASYNRGMGGIQTQIDKQKVDNYYDLLLTEETSRYIYRVLAMKEVISRPKIYGFMLRKKDLYPPIATKKITVDTSISNLADFALSKGINYKVLKTFNPWLMSNSLTIKEGKKYILEIPKNGVNIYDPEGNYEGSDLLSPKDSVNLVITAPPADTIKPELKAPQ